MNAATTTQARQIGAILVEEGLITAAQLEHALRLQEGTGVSFGEILVAESDVSQADLVRVLAERAYDPGRAGLGGPRGADPGQQTRALEPPAPESRLRRPIGEIFVELGFITAAQLEEALVVQRRTGARIGEILVEQGHLTRLNLASALAEHWEPHDPEPGADEEPSLDGAPVTPSEEYESGAESRAAIAELELRLRAVEERGVSAPPAPLHHHVQARQRRGLRRQQSSSGGAGPAEVEGLAAQLASLGNLESRVDELHQSLDLLGAVRASDALATGARIAGVEAAIAGLDGLETRVRDAVDRDLADHFQALAKRLDLVENGLGGVAALEERISELAGLATELRSEFEALADRPEYASQGNGRQRSIERPGAAIVEFDARMADQIPVTEAEGCVAFAPTAAGYRLVELRGRPPEIGASVELEVDGSVRPLVVVRYGRSPLPFDGRPCAYLEGA